LGGLAVRARRPRARLMTLENSPRWTISATVDREAVQSQVALGHDPVYGAENGAPPGAGLRDRGSQPRSRRWGSDIVGVHDRPTLAPRLARSSSSCSNVSLIASAAPVPAASRASFEG